MEDVVCTRCGAVEAVTAGTIPLTWSSDVGDRDVRLLCETCTRAHLRAIEAKLDEAWWG